MRSLIFLPTAPPLLLKTFIKLGVYLSSSDKNLAWRGKVVICMNSAFIYKRQKRKDTSGFNWRSSDNFLALRGIIFWAEKGQALWIMQINHILILSSRELSVLNILFWCVWTFAFHMSGLCQTINRHMSRLLPSYREQLHKPSIPKLGSYKTSVVTSDGMSIHTC